MQCEKKASGKCDSTNLPGDEISGVGEAITPSEAATHRLQTSAKRAIRCEKRDNIVEAARGCCC